MIYFLIIIFQLIVNFGFLFFFKNKIKKEIFTQDIKNELDLLIISFNKYADRNISLIEDKIEESKEMIKIIEEKLDKKKKEHFLKEEFFNKKSKQKKLDKQNNSTISIFNHQKKDKETLQHSSVQKAYQGISNLKTPSISLENYLEEKEQESFRKMTLEEKLSYYKKKNIPNREIAKKLNLSIDEISLLSHAKKNF